MARVHYSVGRIVPNVARGEFLNLAMAVWDDTSCVIRVVEPTERARVFDTKGYLPGVIEELRSLARRVKTPADVSDLPTSPRSILQFTDPTPVAAPDIETTFRVLWDLLVAPEENPDED